MMSFKVFCGRRRFFFVCELHAKINLRFFDELQTADYKLFFYSLDLRVVVVCLFFEGKMIWKPLFVSFKFEMKFLLSQVCRHIE